MLELLHVINCCQEIVTTSTKKTVELGRGWHLTLRKPLQRFLSASPLSLRCNGWQNPWPDKLQTAPSLRTDRNPCSWTTVSCPLTSTITLSPQAKAVASKPVSCLKHVLAQMQPLELPKEKLMTPQQFCYGHHPQLAWHLTWNLSERLFLV